jgi:ADP-heptose:LPS heptosyltransferase
LAQQDLDFKNILVIHFGQLGDVVLGIPAFRAIRERFPASRITALLGKPGADIVRLANVADELFAIDRVALRDGNKLRSIAAIMRLVRDVRRRRFDLVIDLNSLSETNLLGFLSGAKHRLYANRGNRSIDFLGHFRPEPSRWDSSKHAAERYLDVLRPLNIKADDKTLKFVIDENDVESVDDILGSPSDSDSKKTVGLFPGAGNLSRRWSLENFAALADRLLKGDVRPVVMLGPEEAELKETVTRIFPRGIVIIEGLTVAQFIAAVSRLDVFVSNDTGAVHLASCGSVPIVLLLDRRAPTTYLPLAEELTIVRNETIDAISVDDVFDAIMSQIATGGPNDKEYRK